MWDIQGLTRSSRSVTADFGICRYLYGNSLRWLNTGKYQIFKPRCHDIHQCFAVQITLGLTPMLFRFGPPPDSLTDAELATGEWRSVPRPPLWVVHLLSLPVGALMALLVFVAWALLTPRFDIAFESGYKVTVAIALIYFLGMVLQISTYPEMGLSNKSVLGLWPSRLTPYTAYASKLSKRQFIATSVLPFVMLSILPLLFAAVLRTSSGWLIFGSCLAAGIYGTNVVLALPALRLPANCIIAGRGFQPYWRAHLEPQPVLRADS